MVKKMPGGSEWNIGWARVEVEKLVAVKGGKREEDGC